MLLDRRTYCKKRHKEKTWLTSIG